MIFRPVCDSIIFDLDGTLWNASGSTAIGWDRVAKSLNLSVSITPDAISPVSGLPFEECVESLFPGLSKANADFVKNVASFKALQKNGFCLEGYLKNEVIIQGQLEDMYLWAAYSDQMPSNFSVKQSGVRQASLGDADVIHKLCYQLGYHPTLEEVQTHLSKILIHPDYEVLVIERNQTVLGWMTLYKRLRIEDVEFLQVAALVTDERVRGQGLGKALMSYAESRAGKMNLPFVGLHSSLRRTDAHKFYEGIGYLRAKESYFFKKDVVSNAEG